MLAANGKLCAPMFSAYMPTSLGRGEELIQNLNGTQRQVCCIHVNDWKDAEGRIAIKCHLSKLSGLNLDFSRFAYAQIIACFDKHGRSVSST